MEELADAGCLKFESSPKLICQLGESAKMTLGRAEFLAGSPLPPQHEIKVSPRAHQDASKILLELSVQLTRYAGVEIKRRLNTGVALAENERIALMLNADTNDGKGGSEWTEALYLIRASRLENLSKSSLNRAKK